MFASRLRGVVRNFHGERRGGGGMEEGDVNPVQKAPVARGL